MGALEGSTWSQSKNGWTPCPLVHVAICRLYIWERKLEPTLAFVCHPQGEGQMWTPGGAGDGQPLQAVAT